MAAATLYEDFRGEGELVGTRPEVRINTGSATWVSASTGGVVGGQLQRSADGALFVMPASGEAVVARLNTNYTILKHSVGGGGVTVVECNTRPGGFLRLSADYESSSIYMTCSAAGAYSLFFDFDSSSGTTVAPGAVVTYRMEITTTAVRFYINDALVYTSSAGLADATTIMNMRVGFDGVGGTPGYASGSTQLAVGYLHLKTEVSSGALGGSGLAGGSGQPPVTADPVPQVLFSDTFQTSIDLRGSHGETGPLAATEWATYIQYDEDYSPQREESAPHWMRGAGGLTVRGYSVADPDPEETFTAAFCDPEPLTERFTDLPIVLEVVAAKGAPEFSFGFALRTTDPGFWFMGWGATVSPDGGLEAYRSVASSADVIRDRLPFVFSPSKVPDAGLRVSVELWEDHVRLYVGGNLVHVMGGVDTSTLARAEGKVELLNWNVGVEVFRKFQDAPVPLLKRLTLSGVQSASGPLPPVVDPDDVLNPLGPGNEPGPDDTPYASFWTAFNATYEVP